MNEDQTTHGYDGERWLYLPDLKKLAKVLKKVAVVLHSGALDGLCRTAGYSHYNDALHSPRGLRISLDEWQRRLSQEFDLPPDEILSAEESAIWFDRLFVRRGRSAAQAPEFSPPEQRDADDASDDGTGIESIPAGVHHELTVVDSIRQQGIRRR